MRKKMKIKNKQRLEKTLIFWPASGTRSGSSVTPRNNGN